MRFHSRPASAFWLLCVLGSAELQADGVGLSAVRSRRLANPLLDGSGPQTSDRFGQTLATGDLDGDGDDDLAVGVPADDGLLASPVVDSGSVFLYFGEPSGIAAGATRRLAQMPGFGLEASDQHGFALAICDFDDDGDGDLAVGALTESVDGASAAGAVFVYAGRPGGPISDEYLLLTQNTVGISDTAEPGDIFGAALACGDFDNDGFADLAIGAPGEDVGTVENGGRLVVIPGGEDGLEPESSLSFTQAGSGLPSEPEDFDELGWGLAAGDLNGDGHDDLAVGVPGEDLNCGAVHVLFGGLFGPSPMGSLLLTDEALGGLSDTEDRFGATAAVADFNGDAIDDLAIGIPFETFASAGGPISRTGQVAVLYGAAPAPDLGQVDYWAENNIFGPFSSEADDNFGRAIAAADFDGDGFADLAVGHPGEEVVGGLEGAVTVISGSPAGLANNKRRQFVAGVHGVPGPPPEAAPVRAFGFALAEGDFDADGHADLAVGAPFESINGIAEAGAVTVLRGALFADGFESEGTGYWGPTR